MHNINLNIILTSKFCPNEEAQNVTLIIFFTIFVEKLKLRQENCSSTKIQVFAIIVVSVQHNNNNTFSQTQVIHEHIHRSLFHICQLNCPCTTTPKITM